MAKWIRVDANCNRHPRFVAAGPWGAVVVKACWEIAKEYDLADGVLSDLYWSEAYISAWTMFNGMDESSIQGGMKSAIRAGLILETDDGWQIKGWERRQRDEDNARNRKKERDKKAKQRERGTKGDTRGQKGTKGDSPQMSTMSASNGTGRDGTGRKREPSKVPESALIRAADLLHAILAYKPDHRFARLDGKQKADWAINHGKHLDALQRLDGVSWERMDAVIKWLPGDTFWPAQINSGSGFRKKFDRLESEMRKRAGVAKERAAKFKLLEPMPLPERDNA